MPKTALLSSSVYIISHFMIKEAISQFLYRKYNCSFSQCGEDAILANLFSHKSKGFFIDIGAFHPYKFSNTFLFYRKGWNGINIDAAPGSMEEFQKMRPRDINIEAAISERPEQLTYYFLGKGNSMNTFSPDFLDDLDNKDKIKKTIPITTQRLDSILEKHAAGKEINFMTIDVEGLELSVLRSNNWDKFKPQVVLLESFELMNDQQSYDVDIRRFFDEKGYKLISKTINGIMFMRKELSMNPYNHIQF